MLPRISPLAPTLLSLALLLSANAAACADPEPVPPPSPEQPTGRHARVALIHGQLMVRGADAEEYSYLDENATLRDRDSVWTGENSLVELELERDSWIRMGEQAKIELRRLPPDSDFRLWAGSIYVDLSDRLDEGLLVRTSAGDLRAAPATVARIDVLGDDGAAVAVARGRVTLYPDKGDSISVSAGRRLEFALGQEPDFPRPLGDALDRDALERFQQEREHFYSDHPIAGELKESLVGARALAGYGDWIERDHVRYWHPHVSTAWRPFRDGIWDFLDCGWCWRSFEPWGYATCHFGRWCWFDGPGWCWAPRYRWSPAWVAWGSCGDYITWCPLDLFDRPCFIHRGFAVGGFPIDFGCWSCARRSFWRGGDFRVGTLIAAGATVAAFRFGGGAGDAFGRPQRLVRGLGRIGGIAAADRGRAFDRQVSGRSFREFATTRRWGAPGAGTGARERSGGGDNSLAREHGSAAGDRHDRGSGSRGDRISPRDSLSSESRHHGDRVAGSRETERSMGAGRRSGGRGFFDAVAGGGRRDRSAREDRPAERNSGSNRRAGGRGFFDRASGGSGRDHGVQEDRRTERSARHQSAERFDGGGRFHPSRGHSEGDHASGAGRESRNLFGDVGRHSSRTSHAFRAEGGGGERHHIASSERHSGGGGGHAHAEASRGGEGRRGDGRSSHRR